MATAGGGLFWDRTHDLGFRGAAAQPVPWGGGGGAGAGARVRRLTEVGGVVVLAAGVAEVPRQACQISLAASCHTS